jgi:hypothetical protein
MNAVWSKKTDDSSAGSYETSQAEHQRGLPLISGRAISWLSATQAVIQLSGLLVILDACLR